MKNIKLGVIKILKNKKNVYTLIVITCIVSLIYLYKVFSIPTEIKEEIYENTINEEVIYNYKADIIPYALNTKGGVVDIDKAIFSKVTKDIILNINYAINSDKPIIVKGTKKVILTLIADELWNKEYVLGREENFYIEGSVNKIIDNDFAINLNELTNFIKTVEDDINLRPGKYVFQVKPVIDGVIIYNDKQIPIKEITETYIDYSQTEIRVREEKQFIQTEPIINTVITTKTFNVLGNNMSLIKARFLFISVFSITFTLIIINTIPKLIKDRLTESDNIDKKYKSRLINITEDISNLNKNIVLDSFNSLITISDEKDQPILRYETYDKVIYYVIDGRYIFYYEINTAIEEKHNIQEISFKEV